MTSDSVIELMMITELNGVDNLIRVLIVAVMRERYVLQPVELDVMNTLV